MRGRGAVSLVFALVLSGCGLETVETLATPNADFTNTVLVPSSAQQVSFLHSAAPYQGSVFQGYYVYYKVYTSVSIDFSRLQADRDTLAASSTYQKLEAMGYSRLSVSGKALGTTPPSSDSPLDLEPLFLTGLADGDKVTLDFSEFLKAGATPYLSRPVLKLNDVIAPSKPYLYRSSLLATGHVSFWDLPTSVKSTDPDVADWPTTDTHLPGKEINIFLVAYGMTGTLQTVYSKPVPWGVIRSPQ
jgi:hypothetical protein